jgi:hypothetical protein
MGSSEAGMNRETNAMNAAAGAAAACHHPHLATRTLHAKITLASNC